MSKFCLIGKSLPHTYSPALHAALGNPSYGVEELGDVAALERFVKEGDYDGFNVTIPYKKDIIPLLDFLSEEAAVIGAVNTVVRRGGKLFGCNTDADGMRYALSHADIDIRGRNVLILGSGGTSNTAAYVCSGAKDVRKVSRTGELNYTNCYQYDAEIVINATPVGTSPNFADMPVELARFKNLKGVFDCVYNPRRTRLVCAATQMGIPAAGGLGMLVEQARRAHNLFCDVGAGTSVPEERTAELVRELDVNRSNIALIGMAGSGKSTIGRELAKRLSRPFADVDEEIERLAGKSVPDIFRESGEGEFRRLEREVISRVCAQSGAVIATGGGAVLDEQNRISIRANSLVALIRRPARLLAKKGRPLMTDDEAIARMLEEREPIYSALADFCVDNASSVEEAVEKIVNYISKLAGKGERI